MATRLPVITPKNPVVGALEDLAEAYATEAKFGVPTSRYGSTERSPHYGPGMMSPRGEMDALYGPELAGKRLEHSRQMMNLPGPIGVGGMLPPAVEKRLPALTDEIMNKALLTIPVRTKEDSWGGGLLGKGTGFAGQYDPGLPRPFGGGQEALLLNMDSSTVSMVHPASADSDPRADTIAHELGHAMQWRTHGNVKMMLEKDRRRFSERILGNVEFEVTDAQRNIAHLAGLAGRREEATIQILTEDPNHAYAYLRGALAEYYMLTNKLPSTTAEGKQALEYLAEHHYPAELFKSGEDAGKAFAFEEGSYLEQTRTDIKRPVNSDWVGFPTEHPEVRINEGPHRDMVMNVQLGTYEEDGRHYVIPTVVGGVQLEGWEPLKLAKEKGLENYPYFNTAKEAVDWSIEEHANINQFGSWNPHQGTEKMVNYKRLREKPWVYFPEPEGTNLGLALSYRWLSASDWAPRLIAAIP